MHIQCGGHGTELFAAWATVNFHFDKPSFIVSSVFDTAHSFPTSPFCLLEPSSCVAPHQQGLVSPLALSQSLACVPRHVCPYCRPILHLFGHLSTFFDCLYSESGLSPGQIDRPCSDTMNSQCPHPPPRPPFSSPFEPSGPEDICCLCMGRRGVWECTSIYVN